MVSGILLVVILTIIFSVALIGGTAFFLLSTARAIARERSIGEIYSNQNIEKVRGHTHILQDRTAFLIEVKNESTNRFLTTLKAPVVVRLYKDSIYIKPYLIKRAYLINIDDVEDTAVQGRIVILRFNREERQIKIRYRVRNAQNWLNAIQKLKSDVRIAL